MKQIIFITLIITSYLSFGSNTYISIDFDIIEDNCSGSTSITKVDQYWFAKGIDGIEYKNFHIVGCNYDWISIYQFYEPFTTFSVASSTYDVPSITKMELIYNEEKAKFVHDYCVEILDNSGTITRAIIVGSSIINRSSQENADEIEKMFDILNEDTFSTPTIEFTEKCCYLVALDNIHPYASGYTSKELDYMVRYDDGNNKLEYIRDLDRGLELVGFRYHCDNNNTTYTKFIKPNN